ncbi:restriction endonuclease [Paractinoplanes lichenicola]|uniref:Restriction endonuclease n=1 Tax=Paractinoplanes lichenicola TaxID=2802976 RepID=A0ABS1VUW7_9ACTN|nr:restriction endonuclease [Actinoplanes lichenicola]MBL7258223.1 restriction endonuclease [Actinoplanes lichenicola]
MVDGFDLGRLNYREFEEVCRDLFGEILGFPLEVFTPGPDGGIDLRHVSDDGHTVIVQCKHWHGSGTSALLSRLKTDEAPKVRNLKPDRFLLAVSVGLTPHNKQVILDTFAPALRTPSDIYGLDDIVGALRDRPRLVERHFRLWLSSTAVLRTVLDRASHLRSSWLRDELTRTAETFVPHYGFVRAAQVLAAQRVCVITGAPGVGKTTVAMMLAYWHMGHGFQVHEVRRDVDEIDELWRDDEQQVFLYDDFLGQTMLDRPRDNEDRRLVSMISRIRRTPGKALVMTTRSHILGEAQRGSDRLGGPDVSIVTSVVELSDLDFEMRGQIVYNYVSRSSIRQEEKARFGQPEVWEPIVSHRRFSPRLIEETMRLAGPGTPDVVAHLLANLEDPLHIWERIVENELSREAVELLEILFLTGETKPGARPGRSVRLGGIGGPPLPGVPLDAGGSLFQ